MVAMKELTLINGIEYGYYEEMKCIMCGNKGLWLDIESESYTHDTCCCGKCEAKFELEVGY